MPEAFADEASEVLEEASALNEESELVDEASEPRILSSELAFEGRVWDIRREVFEYNGHEITREFIDHPGAVAVLALDDANRVMLIRQYRHPIRSRDWELPAGLLDMVGEDPLEAARRELAEEADLVATEWESLIDFHTSPGGSDELIRVYLARGLSDAEEIYAREEEEADIETRWVALDEVVAAVLDGRLHNSILALAVLAAHARP